jgi:hypothetical protein
MVISIRNMHQPDLMGEARPRIAYEGAAEECQAWIAEQDEAGYICGNNEAGAPERVLAIHHGGDVGDAVTLADGCDMSRYDWPDDMDCECCGECQECITLMIEQDQDAARNMRIERRPYIEARGGRGRRYRHDDSNLSADLAGQYGIFTGSGPLLVAGPDREGAIDLLIACNLEPDNTAESISEALSALPDNDDALQGGEIELGDWNVYANEWIE